MTLLIRPLSLKLSANAANTINIINPTSPTNPADTVTLNLSHSQ